MKKNYLFTSSPSPESSDKVCDRISDMVVDTYLGASHNRSSLRDFNNN